MIVLETMKRTEVCITIDTEFSIAGAFADPDRSQPLAGPMVYGTVDDQEQGLGFLLRCFERYGVSATFFVETLHTAFFGPEPMGLVVRRILDAGQDVQLHVHPVWLTFEEPRWRELLKTRPPNDTLVGRPVDESARILRAGVETLRGWGAPPVALRTGNLVADTNTYRAMHAAGLPVASNLGVGYAPPAERELHVRGGRRRVHGVLEVPTLTFEDWRGPRILTVTGTGEAETRALLWAARRAGLETVVVLTHPFEFFKNRDDRYTRLRRNRVNQQRLEGLCRFLRENEEDFVSRSFGEASGEWLAAADTECPAIRAPVLASVSRFVENRVNDAIWLY